MAVTKLEMKKGGRMYNKLSIYDEYGRCSERIELFQVLRVQAY